MGYGKGKSISSETKPARRTEIERDGDKANLYGGPILSKARNRPLGSGFRGNLIKTVEHPPNNQKKGFEGNRALRV